MDVAQHTFQAPLAVPPISSGVDKTPMLQQQSVIQSNQQLQQQLQSMHDSEDRDGHKRREILTRRPSYRKILDDLSVEGPVKMENYEDNGSSNASSPSTDENSINEKQYQSMQLNGVVPQQGVGPNNVVQYSENQAYTIKGQLPVGLDSTSIASPQQLAEEANRKRELRLYKNREAARECRRKKKEYVKCLENRVAVLENQNKALIEELKSLKDLYCSKEN
ncbi:cyclic AMP-responsive element-binding protein-like isoform X2 [Hydractinia symbiolongicarpus]|uniref:cyclic AMP-responsive element-binding protein-like isoform X2 n=1 Tax=Hydractinia symbiolongicarpus TaxID=13093 RepID=UPI00254FDF1C|nr:cyclic AMP-responsive element-binding protein-like isoform X2 [Hydractinia symbiolongicarpus]